MMMRTAGVLGLFKIWEDPGSLEGEEIIEIIVHKKEEEEFWAAVKSGENPGGRLPPSQGSSSIRSS